jgi:hypothetical protein
VCRWPDRRSLGRDALVDLWHHDSSCQCETNSRNKSQPRYNLVLTHATRSTQTGLFSIRCTCFAEWTVPYRQYAQVWVSLVIESITAWLAKLLFSHSQIKGLLLNLGSMETQAHHGTCVNGSGHELKTESGWQRHQRSVEQQTKNMESEAIRADQRPLVPMSSCFSWWLGQHATQPQPDRQAAPILSSDHTIIQYWSIYTNGKTRRTTETVGNTHPFAITSRTIMPGTEGRHYYLYGYGKKPEQLRLGHLCFGTYAEATDDSLWYFPGENLRYATLSFTLNVVLTDRNVSQPR